MALNKNELVALAKATAKANRSAKTAFSYNGTDYSYSALNDTLRDELNAYCGDYYSYEANKNMIFQILSETIDDVLPKKVLEQYGQFAEVKTYKQGDKPIFTQKITMASKRRAKQFVTKVGLAGIYEVFKLDGKTLEVQTSAFGGAAQIGFEEFLDGRVEFADVLDILMEGLDESVYLEIERALKAAVVTLQAANKTAQAGFDEKSMDQLLEVADSYGPATIYCTFEFAATMLPAQASAWSDGMKEEIWKNGYFTTYKRHKVVVLPQSFEDDKNTMKVIDPQYAWIIPSGADKPVKIALEGQTIVREIENNGDMSREVQAYKKMGVGAMITNNICVYRNTALTRVMPNMPYTV